VDFETYLSARPSILRNTWKRKRELLKKRGNANFQLLGRADEVEPLIAIYEHVRERSWKSAEPFPDFIPNLMRLAGKLGALRFGALIIDGIPAAAQFWIVWGGKATIYKLVYAREFAAVSPGTVLTMEMVRNVLEEDSPVEINFGRGDDAYKKLWLSARREHWGIEAANPRTLGGILRASRIRAAVFRNRLKSKVHTDNRSP
jgi:CelD/BcsL family acetyltransferase involved in cellulose biosynthesis